MKELTEIPLSTDKHSRVAFIIIIATLFVFIIWGYYSQLNSGAIASGEIIPSDKILTIQHQEGGIVEKIYVKDGQFVKKGDKLIELNALADNSEVEIIQNEMDSLEAMIKRLKSERDGVNYLTKKIKTDSMQTQLDIFLSRKESLKNDLEIMKQRIEQTDEEIRGYEAEIKALQTILSTSKETNDMNAELYKNRYIEKKRYLDSQNNLADIEGKIGKKRSDIGIAKQKITETRLQMERIQAQWKNDLLEELRKAQDGLDLNQKKIKIFSDKVNRSIITAPEDGKIHNIKFNTIGSVVKAGEELMQIVPTNENLVVEVNILPDDINSVYVGLKAYVRITAFNQRYHNAIMGEVSEISADTYKDPQRGVSYYRAKIIIDNKELKEVEKMELYPGMLAQAEIVTGERSVIDYLVEPLRASFTRAFKEE
ncbi:MAG: HlyD family type I secretion periplasmic adaptor subunit [Arcobacteraceae bacterium]|jgi:HlyD family type I secretion membrane fusion protein|nr:HlyD family type I secretion periplasmic adaptor subunit [Arcobacteraceae bacterium]